MQKILVVLILFLSANSFGQEIVIKGKITDIDNRDIQNASVSILDAKGIVLNIHLNENGEYALRFQKSEQVKMTLVIMFGIQ
jgi:hypothetical protein